MTNPKFRINQTRHGKNSTAFNIVTCTYAPWVPYKHGLNSLSSAGYRNPSIISFILAERTTRRSVGGARTTVIITNVLLHYPRSRSVQKRANKAERASYLRLLALAFFLRLSPSSLLLPSPRVQHLLWRACSDRHTENPLHICKGGRVKMRKMAETKRTGGKQKREGGEAENEK